MYFENHDCNTSIIFKLRYGVHDFRDYVCKYLGNEKTAFLYPEIIACAKFIEEHLIK